MGVVKLSDSTKRKLSELSDSRNSTQLFWLHSIQFSSPKEDLTLEEVAKFLTNKHEKGADLFAAESLKALLLNDLALSLLDNPGERPPPKPSKWRKKLKLMAAAIAGIIYYGCEGFDGIFSILSLFSLPAVVIFTTGLVFSLLSIAILHGAELAEISKGLGIKFKNTLKIIDLYLQQIEDIARIRQSINGNYTKDKENIIAYLFMVNMLIKRQEQLHKACAKLKDALDNRFLKIAKTLTAAIAGIIFFSGGFFSGQSLALATAAVFFGTVSTTFWPILAVGIFVGIAALGFYWYGGRSIIENLISNWFGLDQETIERLCDEQYIEQGRVELKNLQTTLLVHQATLNKIKSLKEELSAYTQLATANNIVPNRKQANIDDFKHTAVDAKPSKIPSTLFHRRRRLSDSSANSVLRLDDYKMPLSSNRVAASSGSNTY